MSPPTTVAPPATLDHVFESVGSVRECDDELNAGLEAAIAVGLPDTLAVTYRYVMSRERPTAERRRAIESIQAWLMTNDQAIAWEMELDRRAIHPNHVTRAWTIAMDAYEQSLRDLLNDEVYFGRLTPVSRSLVLVDRSKGTGFCGPRNRAERRAAKHAKPLRSKGNLLAHDRNRRQRRAHCDLQHCVDTSYPHLTRGPTRSRTSSSCGNTPVFPPS